MASLSKEQEELLKKVEAEKEADWKKTEGFFHTIIHGLTAAASAHKTDKGKDLPISMKQYECIFAIIGPTEEERFKAKRIITEEPNFPHMVNKFVKGVKEGIREENG